MLADGMFILLTIHGSIVLMALNHDVEGFGGMVRRKHCYLQPLIRRDCFVITWFDLFSVQVQYEYRLVHVLSFFFLTCVECCDAILFHPQSFL